MYSPNALIFSCHRFQGHTERFPHQYLLMISLEERNTLWINFLLSELKCLTQDFPMTAFETKKKKHPRFRTINKSIIQVAFRT